MFFIPLSHYNSFKYFHRTISSNLPFQNVILYTSQALHPWFTLSTCLRSYIFVRTDDTMQLLQLKMMSTIISILVKHLLLSPFLNVFSISAFQPFQGKKYNFLHTTHFHYLTLHLIS